MAINLEHPIPGRTALPVRTAVPTACSGLWRQRVPMLSSSAQMHTTLSCYFFSTPVTQEIVFIEKSLDLYIYEESKRICLIGDQPSSQHHMWVQEGPHGYEPELWDDARIVPSRDRMLPMSPLEHMCVCICHGSVFLVLRQAFPRCGLTPALHTTCPSTHSTLCRRNDDSDCPQVSDECLGLLWTFWLSSMLSFVLAGAGLVVMRGDAKGPGDHQEAEQ